VLYVSIFRYPPSPSFALFVHFEEPTNGAMSRGGTSNNLHLSKGDQLIAAAVGNQLERVAQLLEDPEVDVNFKNARGETALTLSTWKNNGKVVEKLLEDPRLEVNYRETGGYSALFLACEKGY